MTPDVKTVDLARLGRPGRPGATPLQALQRSLKQALDDGPSSREVPEDWACVLGSDGIFDALSDQARRSGTSRLFHGTSRLGTSSRMRRCFCIAGSCRHHLAGHGRPRQGCRQAKQSLLEVAFQNFPKLSCAQDCSSQGGQGGGADGPAKGKPCTSEFMKGLLRLPPGP